MSIWHLVVREIRHRKWNFVFGLLSVTVAVGCLVASLTLLKGHEIKTRHTLAAKKAEQEQALKTKQADVATHLKAKEAEVTKALADKQAEVERILETRKQEVAEAGRKSQDAFRKITKGLGFNIWILPSSQDLNELYTRGTLSETMTEEFVDKLAKSDAFVINHILPMLTHRINDWQGPKQKQTILVVGTRGEVPFAERVAKKPLKDGQTVPTGTIVLGYEVAKRQGLKPKDKVTLLEKEFMVSKIHEQRGTSDDSTVWVNLKDLQKLLGKENLIHVILALECNCASVDRVGDIRKKLEELLPGTQIIERDSRKALARAEARNKAKEDAILSLKQAEANGMKLVKQEKEAGEKLLAQEKKAGAAAIAMEKKSAQEDLARIAESHQTQRDQLESFAAILVPLVIVGCAVWIGLLTYLNVRQRSGEIGILRAIGLRSGEILTIFLTKALLIGVLGATIGYAIGLTVGISWADVAQTGESLFSGSALALAAALALLLPAFASWIPALLAARQDPALVLHSE